MHSHDVHHALMSHPSLGIIRDVMQNHLLQIFSLIGMEPPVSLSAEDVRDEKVKFLRAVRPITLEDLVIGQYSADPKGSEPVSVGGWCIS